MTETWIPKGELTTETALDTLTAGQKRIDQARSDCKINMENIHTVDSAGVAVLLGWFRYAKQQHKHLYLENLPPKLVGMIKLSNLQRIIKLENLQ